MKPGMNFFFPLLCSIWLGVSISAQSPEPNGRIHISFDASEAEAVLGILDKCATGKQPTESDWKHVFSSEPYLRLKKREAQLHRDFSMGEFKAFVLSPELLKKSKELHIALEAWKKADLNAAAFRILPYLPATAQIHAKVFPMIKPKTNSFVFETTTDPAIFLYLDPEISKAKFENTVAHEMHHIGYSSISGEMEEMLKSLPPPARAAAEWIGSFGEGFAMLAAAGGPNTHPHAASNSMDRARWDRDMANFNRDLKTLEFFFLDVIHKRLNSKEEISDKGFTFFGVQGPWYTVGYRMAITIEKHFGRAVLVDCMVDLRKLLPTFNRAAIEENRDTEEPLAQWSQELVNAMMGEIPLHP